LTEDSTSIGVKEYLEDFGLKLSSSARMTPAAV